MNKRIRKKKEKQRIARTIRELVTSTKPKNWKPTKPMYGRKSHRKQPPQE